MAVFVEEEPDAAEDDAGASKENSKENESLNEDSNSRESDPPSRRSTREMHKTLSRSSTSRRLLRSGTKGSRSFGHSKSLGHSKSFGRSKSFRDSGVGRLDQADLEELAVGLKSEEHHELMETQSSSGILADFIEREKAKDGHWRLTNERWLFYFLATKPKLFVGSAADHARGILLREQLECDLMSNIVAERKKEGVMRPTGIREFMSQAKNILSMKRTLGTIAAQVSNWEMNIKMLEWGYKEDDDVVLSRLHDRRLRHEGFWSLYHDRARNDRPATDFSDPEHEESQPVDEPGCGQVAKSDTFQKFREAVEQSQWASAHGCPGALSKARKAVSKLPTSISKNLMNVVSQPSSIGRWAPPRPHSAQHRQLPGAMLRDMASRPASAGGVRRSPLDPSIARSLPCLETPKPVLCERKDILQVSMSSRPTSAGSSRPRSANRSAGRPGSAGSFASRPSRPQSATVSRSWRRTESGFLQPGGPPDGKPRLDNADLAQWLATPQLCVAPKKPSACSRKYLQECDLRATVPDTLDFNTGFSSKLSAPHRGLTDHDLLSVTGMLPERQKVDEVCLKQNSGLTDASLVPFLRQFLKVPRLAEGLRSLNLKQCKGAGWQSLEVLRQLTFAARNLRELNLSGVQVGTHLQLKLCESLGVHRNLQFIGLSRTGLGGTCLTEDCLRHLLSSRSNRKLDLSWNVFSKKDFQVIGDYIAENTSLMHLLLDNTAAYIVGEDTPISELIEKLAFNSALRSLSICTNRIDSRAALVIEDSLEGHPMLSRLYLRNNPLGIHGLRSILRLLCRKESSMSRLDIEGCKSGDEKTKSTETHTKVFSFTNPGGKYILDLGIPYDRSLCRMLYETAERFNLEHNKAFVNINHSHPPYHHPVRDSIGQYKVRREGILTFTFNVESAIAAAWSNVADDDFIGFLNSHLAMMRFEPHKRKLRPLLANWKAISGMHAEQETFLTALASDFNMEVPYLEYMVQACPEASNEILFRLIPSLKRDGCSTFLAMSLFPRVEDLLETQWRMESFLLFNPQNPTGRYKLKLENSTDFAVAQQLLLLDRWESVVNRRHNRGDVSQRGNRSQLRNELYQGRALHLSVKLLTEWAMPEFGEFECDYATSYHPKQGSKPLSDTLWESVMMAIYDSPCRPEDQLKVLKIISHQIFLSSLHIRQMVGFFRKDEDREEALVMFWPRVIDKYNAKVFRVRFEKKEDVVRLQERLGYITFFPYFQPENAVFRFNMAVYEQRVSACLFVQLMLREMPGNIKDPTYEKPDGTLDPMTMGVPRSWADWKQCPSEGVFSGHYSCAPENRAFDFRRKLAETYGYYDAKTMSKIKEEDVMWWTGLTEPPSDILDLLEFLISRFSNVDEAFRKIINTSDTKTPLITLRVFQAALVALDCGKFKGPDENQRLAAIFRYLDPGGEGSISQNEWRVLGQLWNEFDLTIREFVQFLQIAFGEDLQDAWEALDDDQSGELSEEEWFEAVEKIGYFGPARVIFALLDGSDDGDISVNEFQVLENYKPKPKA